MKSILTLAALAVFAAVPALAADQDGARITKGTKSYQSARPASQDSQPDTASNTQHQPDLGNVTKIEPAAGGDKPAEATPADDNGKSFREDMHLPRKN